MAELRVEVTGPTSGKVISRGALERASLVHLQFRNIEDEMLYPTLEAVILEAAVGESDSEGTHLIVAQIKGRGWRTLYKWDWRDRGASFVGLQGPGDVNHICLLDAGCGKLEGSVPRYVLLAQQWLVRVATEKWEGVIRSWAERIRREPLALLEEIVQGASPLIVHLEEYRATFVESEGVIFVSDTGDYNISCSDKWNPQAQLIIPEEHRDVFAVILAEEIARREAEKEVQLRREQEKASEKELASRWHSAVAQYRSKHELQGRNFNSHLEDTGGGTHQVSVRTHFRDLKTPLLEYLSRYDAVIGCMAWFTLQYVMEAAARLPLGCSFVIQKERHLQENSYQTLIGHGLQIEYLPQSFKQRWPTLDAQSKCDPVRCFGIPPVEGQAKPLMHHKFLVFGKWKEEAVGKTVQLRDPAIVPPRPEWAFSDMWWESLDPDVASRNDLYFEVVEGSKRIVWDAVWKGSRNLTKNGSCSLDSADFVVGQEYAEAHAMEFGRILALSENLGTCHEESICPDWGLVKHLADLGLPEQEPFYYESPDAFSGPKIRTSRSDETISLLSDEDAGLPASKNVRRGQEALTTGEPTVSRGRLVVGGKT